MAFKTIIKRPKVRIIKGPKMSFKTGRRIRLMAVRIAAAIRRATKSPVKAKPVIRYAAARIAMAFEKTWRTILPKNFIVGFRL